MDWHVADFRPSTRVEHLEERTETVRYRSTWRTHRVWWAEPRTGPLRHSGTREVDTGSVAISDTAAKMLCSSGLHVFHGFRFCPA